MDRTLMTFTCPDCGGNTEKLIDGKVVQYRCRVGHLYSPQTAFVVHAEREENTIWSAAVVLQEGADLADDVASDLSGKDGADLRAVAAAKRELAKRVEELARQFPGTKTAKVSSR